MHYNTACFSFAARTMVADAINFELARSLSVVYERQKATKIKNCVFKKKQRENKKGFVLVSA